MQQLERLQYLSTGALKRLFGKPPSCPCCNGAESAVVDRKLVYSLRECSQCGILFRYPGDTATAMEEFYQEDYEQTGLTTDLPDDVTLAKFLASGFKGTEKDFSRVIEILQALDLAPGCRILDYGANWGYASYQLQRAGFSPTAFEISRPRAAFGQKLGIDIATTIESLPGPFSATYSGHVLEHVPSPLQSLAEQLERTVPGGYVIGHTPNGSQVRREKSFYSFHKHWGRIHPCLLSDSFLLRFHRGPAFISSRTDPQRVKHWDRSSTVVEQLEGDELFFILRKA